MTLLRAIVHGSIGLMLSISAWSMGHATASQTPEGLTAVAPASSTLQWTDIVDWITSDPKRLVMFEPRMGTQIEATPVTPDISDWRFRMDTAPIWADTQIVGWQTASGLAFVNRFGVPLEFGPLQVDLLKGQIHAIDEDGWQMGFLQFDPTKVEVQQAIRPADTAGLQQIDLSIVIPAETMRIHPMLANYVSASYLSEAAPEIRRLIVLFAASETDPLRGVPFATAEFHASFTAPVGMSISAIPEPDALTLWAIGLAAMAWRRRSVSHR